MAEEVLREGQGAGEVEAEANTGFEGMETLARAIELGTHVIDISVALCVILHVPFP